MAAARMMEGCVKSLPSRHLWRQRSHAAIHEAGHAVLHRLDGDVVATNRIDSKWIKAAHMSNGTFWPEHELVAVATYLQGTPSMADQP
jgi:hypothetical protein